MANTPISFDEIRFDVRDPELTHAYVYVRDMDGSFPIVRGWHHKTFPASMSTLQIMTAWAEGKENPLHWARNAPPNFPVATPSTVLAAGPASATSTDCPHASPFRYCPSCVVSPCPVGMPANPNPGA